jgi:hypothetical protein
MSSPSNLSEADLGYRFCPKSDPESIGHPCLEVHISSTPSLRHFDPTSLHLRVFTLEDKHQASRIEQLEVHHPWTYEDSYQVAPGMLIISDRKKKKVEALTFGGMLQIDTGEEETLCVIKSQAPIIPIDAATEPVQKLVEEVEILFAERRAYWLQRAGKKEFEKRLVKLSPPVLYAACLEEFINQHQHTNYQDLPEIHDFYQLVSCEKRHLMERGEWPEAVPSISVAL